MTADLTNPIFTDETKAREYLEGVRWPNGAYCPHCGEAENVVRLHGKSHRPGLFQCNSCRQHFTVTVGTLYERSHIPLHKWLLATHLLTSSKKGISAHQLHRMLGITYKSAWFMAHRIREAMKDETPGPMGGPDKIVEADETFLGPKNYEFRSGKGWKNKGPKYKVVALVERGGKARSIKVDRLTSTNIRRVLVTNVDRKTTLMTDEGSWYRTPGREFAKHETVNHKKDEYVRGEVSTNTAEGFFSIFKRGMKGIYQHCGEAHLQRYLTEFDFRYNHRTALGVNDNARCEAALKGITGKRLTYRRTRFGSDF
jgi:transposase-like protein